MLVDGGPEVLEEFEDSPVWDPRKIKEIRGFRFAEPPLSVPGEQRRRGTSRGRGIRTAQFHVDPYLIRLGSRWSRGEDVR